MDFIKDKFVSDIEAAIEELRVGDWLTWERWAQGYWLGLAKENGAIANDAVARAATELGSRAGVGGAFAGYMLQSVLEGKLLIVWLAARRKMPTLTQQAMKEQLVAKDMDRLIERFDAIHSPEQKVASGNGDSQSE